MVFVEGGLGQPRQRADALSRTVDLPADTVECCRGLYNNPLSMDSMMIYTISDFYGTKSWFADGGARFAREAAATAAAGQTAFE